MKTFPDSIPAPPHRRRPVWGICFCGGENLTSLPRAHLQGELAPQASERLDKGRLSSERNNAGAALYNLSVIFASLDATSPDKGRLWHSVTFSSKRKSVSSKTKPLCQGLSCQESCRADARLRGWTKDAFRLSGITQVLLCTTSPSSSLRSMPPPLAGEALAFRDVF